MHSRDPVLASLHRLMLFSQSVRVRRIIAKIALEPKQTFWVMTVNVLSGTATVEWCKVFGSWGEDTHWTQVIPKERHDIIQAGLLGAVGLSQEDWGDYRESILSYRNQMVAHHDLNARVAKYPNYDVGMLAANFMFEQIRGVADPESLGGIPASLDRWSRTVSGHMSAIVRRAFEASAILGSDVLPGSGA